MAMLSGASKKRPLQLVGLGLFALLLASCGPGGCGSAPTSIGNTATPTAIPTDTTTAAASATPSPTATHVAPTPTHAPTATATHAAPTPTPLPPLQAVLLYDNLTGAVGTAPGNNSPIHDVTCPAGYLVAGGGINSGYTNFTIMVSAPISTTTWRGEVFNNSSGTISAQLQVICLKVSGLTSQIVTVSLPGPIGSGSASAASATCPAGYLLAGGGISSGYTNFTHSVDSPGSTTRWDATVTNHDVSPMYAQLQIVCLRVSSLHSTLVHASLGTNIVNGANSGGHDAVCPAGYLVAGGGIQVSYSDYTTMFSAPISTTKWRGAIHNNGSGTMPYQYVVATCLKRS